MFLAGIKQYLPSYKSFLTGQQRHQFVEFVTQMYEFVYDTVSLDIPISALYIFHHPFTATTFWVKYVG
jgi:hypothetical protein